MKNSRNRKQREATKPKEKPIGYYNGERYADPTAFAAVKNMVKKQRTTT